MAKHQGLAALIATHNPSLAARMDRTVRMEQGVLVEV
jgi:lipoprotein-releasing system ATP-binding protein